MVHVCQFLHTEHEIRTVGSSLSSALSLRELSHKPAVSGGFILALAVQSQMCHMV